MVRGYTNAQKRTGQYPLPKLHQFLKHETIEVLLLPPLPPLDGTTPEGDSHIKLMGMLLVSLRHTICRFWFPFRVLHTWKDRKPINVSLWVVSNKIHCIPVADPLFLDQNEAQRAEKKIFEAAPPYLRVWMTCPSPPLSEGPDLPLYPYKKENAAG